VVAPFARADQSDGLTDATPHAVTLVVFIEEDLPSSGGCSVSHLRCPESAGNLRHQRTRRDRAVFLISPTDSGLRRLEKELCADIIIGRLLGQSSAAP